MKNFPELMIFPLDGEEKRQITKFRITLLITSA